MAEVDINVPPPQNSPKNIINILNNDCLQAILLKIENVNDFYKAAKVCTRFQNNAKICFPFKKLRIACTLEPQEMIDNIILHEDAENFLSIFATKIECLHITLTHKISNSNDDHFHDNVIDMIAKYCGNTLVELQIFRGKFNDFRQPFEVLKIFRICQCSIRNFDPTVAFPELKGLQVSSMKIDNVDWLANKFPNLECFHISHTILTDDLFIKFQLLNPQLQRLGVYSCRNLTSSIWKGIGDRLPNIHTLYDFLMRFSTDDLTLEHITDIGTLQQLKELTLFSLWDGKEKYLSAMKSIFSLSIMYKQPIEILKLQRIDTELGEILQNVNTLKALYIQNKCSESILLNLIKHLSALEDLRVFNPDLFVVEKILQQAKKLAKLTFHTALTFELNHSHIRVFNSIVALATDRTKVKIFCDMTQITKKGVLNEEETDILSQILSKKNEWVHFKEVGSHAWTMYRGPNFP